MLHWPLQTDLEQGTFVRASELLSESVAGASLCSPRVEAAVGGGSERGAGVSVNTVNSAGPEPVHKPPTGGDCRAQHDTVCL